MEGREYDGGKTKKGYIRTHSNANEGGGVQGVRYNRTNVIQLYER